MSKLRLFHTFDTPGSIRILNRDSLLIYNEADSEHHLEGNPAWADSIVPLVSKADILKSLHEADVTLPAGAYYVAHYEDAVPISGAQPDQVIEIEWDGTKQLSMLSLKDTRIIKSWIMGKWISDPVVSGAYQVLDADDKTTPVLRVHPSISSPQKTVDVLI